MRRFLNKLLSNFRSTNAARSARRAPRRASLQVEGLEQRTVLSTASLSGSTLLVTADPGTITIVHGNGTIGIIPEFRQITFKVDASQPKKFDVLDGNTLLGQFAARLIKNVEVNVQGLDSMIVDDSNVLPFVAGTNISIFGSGQSNSLTLTGTRTINGGETYTAGEGDQGGSLTLGGSTYEFSNTIGSVIDQVKTTAPLVVKASANFANVTMFNQDSKTQTLTGLANGGAGDFLRYSNKNLVNLELSGTDATANLNAAAAAAGEHFFVIDTFSDNQIVHINATPSTVDTNVVAAGLDEVFVTANSGRVFVNGTSSASVIVGSSFGPSSVTSGIKRDVFIENVGTLYVLDSGNNTTQENVLVTESTISGIGLFGNNAVVVHYSLTGVLALGTGQLANTYAIAASTPGATFASRIDIGDESAVGLSVVVTLDAESGLNLNLTNNPFRNSPAPASLFISGFGGTFSDPTPNPSSGTEIVTFPGGLDSEVTYSGFSSVNIS
ncbi:MAG TPA: hypothetical protein VKU02_01895 [Gemmataceae bacterium]|nr:hypothetical protein [Gemmataceae bacterium]